MADAPEHYVPLQQNLYGTYAPVKSTTEKEVVGSSTAYNANDNNDIEGDSKKPRRICGLPLKTAIIVGIVLLAAVIGGVLGGVLGTRSKKSDPSDPSDQPLNVAPTATTTPSSTSTSVPVAEATNSKDPEAPPIVVPQNEMFDSQWWHSITTYGENDTITRTSGKEAQDQRRFIGIIGSFQPGTSNVPGDIGIVPFADFTDQYWNLRPAKAAQVPNATLYASYKKQLPLQIITCQRYGRTVRLALDGKTPDAILTLVTQNDTDASQFWWVEQFEADIEGEYGRYLVKNYAAGDNWHMMVGGLNNFGKRKAPMKEGKPTTDMELWQIIPQKDLTGEEREQWGTVV